VSIVEYRGGPVTHRYLMNKSRDWLARAYMDMLCIFERQKPIPMVLHCPKCGRQHVDEADPASGWTNPPHKSHLCDGCGCIWRPAVVPTNGVSEIATRGAEDNWWPHPPCLNCRQPMSAHVKGARFLHCDPRHANGDEDCTYCPAEVDA